MSDRAFNNGVVVGAAIMSAVDTTKRGARATGVAVKATARSTKDVTSSFWAGFRSGIKQPSAQLGTSTPSAAKPIEASHIIVVRT